MRVNRELKGKTAEKRLKRPRAKKADTAVGTQETDETVETEESQRRRRGERPPNQMRRLPVLQARRPQSRERHRRN
jgi:hypothetical protein